MPFPRRSNLVYVVALGCVAALLLTSCSGSGKHAQSTTGSAVPSTDAKHRTRVSLALQLGPIEVQAVDVVKPFGHEAALNILKLVNAYIATGITRPLFTGSEATGLARYFAPALATRVGPKGRDRRALTDELTPVMTTVSKAVKQRLTLVGLQNHGRLLIVGARLAIYVKGDTAQGPLVVSHIGDLVLEPDSYNHWHITGYSLFARRDTATSSTTQKATTTTAAK
jgi:hypothetical protein